VESIWIWWTATSSHSGGSTRAQRGEWGSGFSAEHRADRADHLVGVEQDIVIPESKHPEAEGPEPLIPFSVAGVVGVLAAVDFDDEPPRQAGEVDDVSTNRLLAAESFSHLTVAQVGPQNSFGLGHGAPEAARPVGSLW